MISRLISNIIKIVWYSVILFTFCIALVLTDKDMFAAAFAAILVNVAMVWISAEANK